VPTRLREASAESASSSHAYSRETSRLAKSLFSTMPVVLVGSLAIASMNMTGPIDTSALKRPNHPDADSANLGTSLRDAYAARSATSDVTPVGDLSTASAPSTYTVRGGDTVSGIAGRYGLATASVLALNGLSWKSLIFPGQVLKLTHSAPAKQTAPAKSTAPAAAPAKSTTTTSSGSSGASKYKIVAGDTLTRIAARFGVSLQTLLSVNGLGMSSIIYAGHTITIPGRTTVASTPASKPAAPAPVVSAPVVVTPAAPARNSTYKIASGDTITSIAKKHGVTIRALLAANGLTAASIIYAGRTLVVPGAASAPVTQVAQVGATVTPLSPTMKANALTIIAVGKQRGVPQYGIIVALAAAAQESGLQNLAYGDLDSIGLFQQRPSSGWGAVAQLENTTYAAQLFYGGPSNPNRGKTRGLLDIPGWQSLTVTQAAQAVQISAYPTAYAKWEASARAWYAALA
jgi:LysM repeat protein